MDKNALLRTYQDLVGPSSDLYYQQSRTGRNFKWLRLVKGQATDPTADHFRAHLDGTATHAVSYQQGGLTTLAVADDDHGGLAAAQAAVNHLADQQIPAFAIARFSLHLDGSPRHNGSRLFVPLDVPSPVIAIRPALTVLLGACGYSTSEILKRAELPFGRSLWTPSGDEWGQFILPYRAPQPITSGWQGLELLLVAEGQQPASAAHLLSFAPPAVPLHMPVPRHPTGQPTLNAVDHRQVVQQINHGYTVHDVCRWKGLRPCGPRNYRCDCGQHPHNDQTPSIGISADGQRAYFNAPGCRYHNEGRHYTAFSLWQTLSHHGDYYAAVDAGRTLLNLPSFPATPLAVPRESKVPQATPPIKEPTEVVQIISAITQRAQQDRSLTKAEQITLQTIVRLAAERAWCAPTTAELAELTGYSQPTAKRSVAALGEAAYLAKHPNQNQRGGYGPNILELLPPPILDGSFLIHPTGSIKETEIMGTAVLTLAEHSAPCVLHASDPAQDSDSSFFNRPEDLSAEDWASALCAFDRGKLRAWCEVRNLDFWVMLGPVGKLDAQATALALVVPPPELSVYDPRHPRQRFARWVERYYERRGEAVPDDLFWTVLAGAVDPPAQWAARPAADVIAEVRELLGSLLPGARSQARAVAIGDAGAAVAELEGEGLAGGILVQPFIKRLAQELLGVSGAEGMHAQAGATADARSIPCSGDLTVRLSGQAVGVTEHVVAILGDITEDVGIKQAGDQALAAPFGVGALNVDGSRCEVDVFCSESGDLVDAQTAGECQARGHLHLAGQVVDDRPGVGEREAESGCRAGDRGGDLRCVGGVSAPPASLAQGMLQLVDGGDGSADAAAGQSPLLAVPHVGDPVIVGDLPEFQQVPAMAFLLDPLDGGDGARFVGAQALITEQGGVIGSLGLGLVAAGARLENSIEGVGHLLDEGSLCHLRGPPGSSLPVAKMPGSGGQWGCCGEKPSFALFLPATTPKILRTRRNLGPRFVR